MVAVSPEHHSLTYVCQLVHMLLDSEYISLYSGRISYCLNQPPFQQISMDQLHLQTRPLQYLKYVLAYTGWSS